MSPLFEYPVFEADQVLTANHLNSAIDYLTRQDLNTRRKLIGIGIVCGLEVSSDGSTYVDISKGVGVTSLGYLISQPDVHLTYYRPFADKATPPYAYFGPEGARPPMWEMYTAQEYLDMEDDEMLKIEGTSDFVLSEMAVLLYLEIEDKDLQKCIGEDCLEKGINRIHRVKRLLIDQDDLLELITEGKDISTEEALRQSLNAKCNLPAISLERLNYKLSDLTSLNLDQISSWQRLKDAYGEAAQPAALRIGKALFESYEVHKTELSGLYDTNPFEGFQLSDPTANALFDLLRSTVDSNDLSVQYAYDLLRDLMLAYNEFADASAEYMAICCPDENLFPLHLMLDKAIPDEGVKSVFRHYFIPSPALNGQHASLDKLKMLFQKMLRMVEIFEVPFFNSVQNIRITPGKWTCNPLSKRAMGFYYPITEVQPLYNFWSYELARKCKSSSVLSYYGMQYSGLPHVQRPLLYDITNFNHFRIEGHIGLEYQSVKKFLEEQVRNFNLSFDVLGIKLSRDHLDVEVEDSCFNDLQTTYKCNRDEYLSCVRSITVFIENIVEPLEKIFTKYPQLLSYQIGGEGSALPFINTIGDLYLILQLYYYQLQQVEVRLPEHIKNFDYNLFRVPHFIVYAFTLIIQIILEMLSNNIREVQLSLIQFMAVKALFERVIDDCMDSKFKSLYEMFQQRKLELQLGRLFPGYSAGRAGLEHIAGVEKGGTFILVYDETPQQPDQPEEPGDEPRDPRDPCFHFSKAQTLKAGVMEFAYSIYEQSYLVNDLNFFVGGDDVTGFSSREEAAKDISGKQEKFNATTGFNQQRYTNQSRQSFEPQYSDPEVFIRDKFGTSEKEQVPRKTYRVVADFAVPYRCCSSCLAVEELPREDIRINLQGDEFCRKDTKRYPFDLSPEGGKVEGEGVVSDENGNYYFQPSEASGDSEEVEITYYATEDSRSSITVKVYNPQAAFTENRDKLPGSVILENTSTGADTYEWTIHDTNETYSTKNLVLSASDYEQNELKVSLTARRGPCSDTTEPVSISLRDPQVEVSINLPSNDFCKGDSAVPFTLSPAGGTLSPLNGVTQLTTGGTYFFNPQLAVGNNITFTYTAGGSSATTSVTIHNPKAAFEVVSNDQDKLVLQDKSENAENVSWFVNGMQVSASGGTLSIPLDGYEGNTVNVRLLAHAWECEDEFKMDIPISRQVVEFELQQPKGSTNYEYCNNDGSQYFFSTSPQGGQITGATEGVKQGPDGQWFFVPRGVTAGTYSFNYMGSTISITVKDVPELKLSHRIIGQVRNQVTVEFTLQTTITGDISWSFPDTGQGFERPYTGPISMNFPIQDGTSNTVTVVVGKALENGCFASDRITINLLQGSTDPLGGGGGRVVNVSDWLNQPATVNLSSSFSAHTTFMANSNSLGNKLRSAEGRKKIADGSMGAAIAKDYSGTMSETMNGIQKLKSRSDAPARDHLALLYLAQVEDVVQVLGAHTSDLNKNSNLYKLGQQISTDLASLKKQGVNINPQGQLQKIVDRYRSSFRGKANAEEIMDAIENQVL